MASGALPTPPVDAKTQIEDKLPQGNVTWGPVKVASLLYAAVLLASRKEGVLKGLQATAKAVITATSTPSELSLITVDKVLPNEFLTAYQNLIAQHYEKKYNGITVCLWGYGADRAKSRGLFLRALRFEDWAFPGWHVHTLEGDLKILGVLPDPRLTLVRIFQPFCEALDIDNFEGKDVVAPEPIYSSLEYPNKVYKSLVSRAVSEHVKTWLDYDGKMLENCRIYIPLTRVTSWRRLLLSVFLGTADRSNLLRVLQSTLEGYYPDIFVRNVELTDTFAFASRMALDENMAKLPPYLRYAPEDAQKMDDYGKYYSDLKGLLYVTDAENFQAEWGRFGGKMYPRDTLYRVTGRASPVYEEKTIHYLKLEMVPPPELALLASETLSGIKAVQAADRRDWYTHSVNVGIRDTLHFTLDEFYEDASSAWRHRLVQTCGVHPKYQSRVDDRTFSKSFYVEYPVLSAKPQNPFFSVFQNPLHTSQSNDESAFGKRKIVARVSLQPAEGHIGKYVLDTETLFGRNEAVLPTLALFWNPKFAAESLLSSDQVYHRAVFPGYAQLHPDYTYCRVLTKSGPKSGELEYRCFVGHRDLQLELAENKYYPDAFGSPPVTAGVDDHAEWILIQNMWKYVPDANIKIARTVVALMKRSFDLGVLKGVDQTDRALWTEQGENSTNRARDAIARVRTDAPEVYPEILQAVKQFDWTKPGNPMSELARNALVDALREATRAEGGGAPQQHRDLLIEVSKSYSWYKYLEVNITKLTGGPLKQDMRNAISIMVEKFKDHKTTLGTSETNWLPPQGAAYPAEETLYELKGAIDEVWRLLSYHIKAPGETYNYIPDSWPASMTRRAFQTSRDLDPKEILSDETINAAVKSGKMFEWTSRLIACELKDPLNDQGILGDVYLAPDIIAIDEYTKQQMADFSRALVGWAEATAGVLNNPSSLGDALVNQHAFDDWDVSHKLIASPLEQDTSLLGHLIGKQMFCVFVTVFNPLAEDNIFYGDIDKTKPVHYQRLLSAPLTALYAHTSLGWTSETHAAAFARKYILPAIEKTMEGDKKSQAWTERRGKANDETINFFKGADSLSQYVLNMSAWNAAAADTFFAQIVAAYKYVTTKSSKPLDSWTLPAAVGPGYTLSDQVWHNFEQAYKERLVEIGSLRNYEGQESPSEQKGDGYLKEEGDESSGEESGASSEEESGASSEEESGASSEEEGEESSPKKPDTGARREALGDLNEWKDTFWCILRKWPIPLPLSSAEERVLLEMGEFPLASLERRQQDAAGSLRESPALSARVDAEKFGDPFFAPASRAIERPERVRPHVLGHVDPPFLTDEEHYGRVLERLDDPQYTWYDMDNSYYKTKLPLGFDSLGVAVGDVPEFCGFSSVPEKPELIGRTPPPYVPDRTVPKTGLEAYRHSVEHPDEFLLSLVRLHEVGLQTEPQFSELPVDLAEEAVYWSPYLGTSRQEMKIEHLSTATTMTKIDIAINLQTAIERVHDGKDQNSVENFKEVLAKCQNAIVTKFDGPDVQLKGEETNWTETVSELLKQKGIGNVETTLPLALGPTSPPSTPPRKDDH